MLFSIGVETPSDDSTAYGLVVPALCNDEYACLSAADSPQTIAPMAREAIFLIVEEMVLSGGYAVEQLKDAGYLNYAREAQYQHCDSWFVLEVDLSSFAGKQQRINIALPDTLIQRIDNRVQEQPASYRDRSHFIATAARRELQA